MQDVFIIGAKGIGNYGGYETFLKKLIETDKENKQIKYHVACKYNGQGAMDENKLPGAKTIDDHHFTYYNADCFKIDISEKLGPAQAIYYDVAAFKECIRQIKAQQIAHPIVYVLACRIGPFVSKYVKQLHQLGGQLFVNPDGHEWMRAKWSKPVRKYWKLSEAGMVKHADLLVCDSVNIEKYIQTTYVKYQPKTTYIAYGADVTASNLTADSEKVRTWYAEKGVRENNYFLVVGRFVPENNYATMIAEFMKSKVKKGLVIITNVEHNKFYEELKKETSFDKDPRIKFVGTVYDGDLLKYIRENAFGYLHGHSVGGTNPSLLEALSSTKLNLLYDVGFNREVGKNAALYWTKENGSLKKLLDSTESMDIDNIRKLGINAKKRIENSYSWEYITEKYNAVLISEANQR
ncbi:beta 1-4 rhamnosyltransferase Cps2T [Limosilactobacillus reuteri]|uniref:beta 1-4 rhamnosyltransferase Cps2T n=1 Tax=Limosilactobacillus reuteri TaxID=1598 RepID=UPI003F20E75C